ncbi:MAG: hypothetical protein IPO22_08935 [Anaerolineales bacterium]|nr:hypothetical protein [Anaerolineales bacterium]
MAQNSCRKTSSSPASPRSSSPKPASSTPVLDKRIAILDADFNILSDYVRKFHAGTWPAPILPAASSIAPENEDVPLVCD